MSRYKEKKCIDCGKLYIPTGASQKRCKLCQVENKKAYQSSYQMEWRRKNGDKAVGVGKGGSNKRFTEHKQYKTGIGNFHKLRKHLKQTLNKCERCGKDLSYSGRYEWCVHHKDHNRTHNTPDNLELLCKRCHQIEHTCAANLPQQITKCRDYPKGVGI